MVSIELLEKLKQLYFKKYNISLTHEEATEMATSLINLMKILLKPESIKDEGRQDATYTEQSS